MKVKILLVILPLLMACSKKIKQTEKYYKLVEEIPSDLSELKEAVMKSKVFFKMDFESGKFEGRYKSLDFEGKYIIEHRSAGFAKGFLYTVKLDSLDKNNKPFFEDLAQCNKIYFEPDLLANPTYYTLELSCGEKKLVFVKLKE